MSNSRTDTGTLLALTFVVSFCSFAYEFVYSELLTVMYGGTVTQYVITVGLYFFSLGIGAALSDDLDAADLGGNFFRTEVFLAAAAPAGFLLIVGLNSVRIPQSVPPELIWTVARLPVVVVGFLSGFELPLLTHMVDELEDGETAMPVWIQNACNRVHNTVVKGLGTVWSVERTDGRRSGLSVVLAMDYVGGLVGAVIYARVLYPGLGLIPTIFVLALLNGVAALVFVTYFGDWSRWPVTDKWSWRSVNENSQSSTRALSVGHVSKTLLVVCLVLTASYAGVVAKHETADEQLSQLYLEQQTENKYPPGAMRANVVSQGTTTYQHVIRYNRTWTGTGPNPHFTGKTEQCLRLGSAIQLCESWADSYHQGLVDVPMSLVEPGPETKVLVVGGGDWIAIDHLRKYNVTVDHVDLDGEFMQQTKTDPFFRKWHDDAYEYDRLNTTTADGYRYLQESNETYDLVLLDIPGATDDDLLTLYSAEFYSSIRNHLSDEGVVVTWGYSPDGYPQHHKAFINTVGAAGFTNQLSYWVREDIDSDGQSERIEQFYVFAPGDRQSLTGDGETAYVRKHREQYRTIEWHAVPRYRGVRVNSIFHPNYDILIDT
ncbi:spermidine synthase (plasmid) [Haloferax mediterranei ATCC 33500]|uniref:Polyamine aminopropyltransferase n=1 Tax=Haloferax mediterranei (strain ATCC 33500 / DSM 1411 / JCM 8866 / NBRC 14739 / NCIMB 2177 / R-4) TaxID=523841 RepID=I3R9D2_HALMT|nr:spermidine synthase [Haloferax mediterranei]AFK20842.1 spermidine synthase [Haloferax mediterranei ATCC 33500]AHZ24282.1 spermidine synthase [Haloferax mediterranei ATCC 33500]EMA05366.1 spermidine synthase [Haloferax mediterranei ATCC 33500]MDX5989835.1 spermidine synthase [Haloferax mediterranei ATCC 33500]QCQ77278.1 spermidine synthase [Haloferax mediterranei ATCC 33500]